ncbi:MAG: OmpA family protein [Verrucomicrobia bacterium]|nr:OmpA family protein [Verrucomicrobiota bacterium]
MRTCFHLAIALMLVALPACCRSKGEVWEDTKTCGRQMRLGLASLFGRHGESRQVHSEQEFCQSEPSDFIPLQDEDLYSRVVLGEKDGAPQSSISPGTPGSGLPTIDGFYEPSSGELARLLQKIHFDTDDYTVRNEASKRNLNQLAEYLVAHPGTYLFIEGHCDERGPAAYNLALGARRSNCVRNYLIKHGVNLNQLFTVSYGKEKPLVKGQNEATWRENRRAQFKVYEKG